jgi:uncharacterized cofD-like protein
MNDHARQKIVVIGGGTGTSVVIEGLRPYDADVTAIITVADSGGSTGRLRDEFGFLPVGDLRQALAASSTGSNQDWIKKLLLYRFTKGSGLEGHNLGNLILTALQDITQSTPQAIEVASSIFRLKSQIVPVTTNNIQLVIEYENGTIEIGEKVLDESHGGQKIVGIKTSPKATLYSKAQAAIETADKIIIGPGDLYGSIMANLIISGIMPAFKKTTASIYYVLNLMTHFTQTHNMSGQDHVDTIENALGKPIDHIVINTGPINKEIIKLYQSQHEYPVADDICDRQKVILGDFIRSVKIAPEKGDRVKRSYLRHDATKLAQVIMQRT